MGYCNGPNREVNLMDTDKIKERALCIIHLGGPEQREEA